MALVISKSKFKPQALYYFREVEEKGEEIIITDHNRPVASIKPFQADVPEVLAELRGSVIRYDDPLEPVGLDDWELLE